MAGNAHHKEFPRFDVAIVGSGLAGFALALHLAQSCKVALITKRTLSDSASDWAQGGIAAVLDSADSIESHVQDTLVAGAGLCDEAAVRHIVSRAPAAIDWLINCGVPFTPDASAERGFHLTQEGGHSHRRIIHAADATGHAVQSTLEQKIRSHPNIVVLEHHIAIDLIAASGHCHGLYVLETTSGEVIAVAAAHTVLATGGAGKAYLHTTNPDTATGDGIAMAWRAGCRVANMEFIQFHPTCLYHPEASSFLISEAVRGEGGILKLPLGAGADAGQRFMPAHDARAELAPRDVVARAIDDEIKKRGLDHVDLDISHQPAEFLRSHFPTIHARCLSLGIDMATQPIPVVPAAHYTCGGVVTDLAGRTDLHGLYAIGETACTGLHGANRLASNSLLECLVLASGAATHILQHPATAAESLPVWDKSERADADDESVIAHDRNELRRLMWDYVGIVRTSSHLQRAQTLIGALKAEINAYYGRFRISPDLIELRNLLDVASLIVDSALLRKESRGLHYSRDFPQTLAEALPTVLSPRARR